MKLFVVLFLIGFSPLTFSQKQVEGNPFENGDLNSKLEGQLIALAGEVIEIKDGIYEKKIFKIDVHLEGVNSIWVMPFIPATGEPVFIGSKLVSRGYIAVDPKISELIGSPTFLLALEIDLLKKKNLKEQ